MLLIAPTVLVFTAVIVYPLLSAIYLSLFSIYTPTLQGEWVGLANYQRLLAKGEFWISLRNTLVWTAGTLTLQIVLGVVTVFFGAHVPAALEQQVGVEQEAPDLRLGQQPQGG